MQFNTFLDAVHKAKPRLNGRFRGRLLSLDPGETTGWSVWDSYDSGAHYELFASGQLETWNKSAQISTSPCILPAITNFAIMIDRFKPDEVVLESYRVYEWKSESHSWSDVPTLRIIGVMESELHRRQLPYYFQTAQMAKNFCTDERLVEWGLWKKGERHARDSMRHGLYFLLFGPQGKQA